MAVTDNWLPRLLGFFKGFFYLGSEGPKFTAVGQKVSLRANDGTSDAEFDVAKSTQEELVLISPTDGKKITISFPDGAALDRVFKLPSNAPNNGDTLVYDSASGELKYATPGGYTSNTDFDITFASATPMDLVALVDGAFVDVITVIVETAFNGTPKSQLQIGVAGTTNKFVDTSEVDLNRTGTYIIDCKTYQATAAQMIATITQNGATAGAAKIIVATSKPA